MKKALAILLAVLLVLSLCACGCKHSYDRTTGKCKECGELCVHDWNVQRGTCRVCNMTCYHEKGVSEVKPCSTCGFKFETYTSEDVGQTTEFFRLPGHFESQEAPEVGTLERVPYTTSVYEEADYEKSVYVYLPYNYDANRAEPYNVVYFQHGNNSTTDMIVTGKAKNLLDNMFYYTDTEPVIIVNVSFYTVVDDSSSPAKDGFREGTGEFEYYKEIIADVLPLVEAKYNTYTTSFDEAGLKATRDHRAFTGYSRGSACTWKMFMNAFEYFEWWSPMSGNAGLSSDATNEEVFAEIKSVIDANSDLDFFIYAAKGGKDDVATYADQIKYFASQTGTFSFGKDPEKNNLYITIADYAHGDPCSPFYYYNSFQTFFK